MSVKLSVVLATRNEEANIGQCLESVRGIADEIVVVDEESEDKTSDIAKKFGARVYSVKHEQMFHKSKQKAIDLATGEWILQLDADEKATPELSKEIKSLINMTNEEIVEYEMHQSLKNPKYKLFKRHEKLIKEREGKLTSGSESFKARRGKDAGQIVAFFVPRRNYFLGRPLIHAGVYPDGVIRLIKRKKARFPSKSVHELMEIDGEVGWLFNDLEHNDSPTFNRYLERANRYTDLTAKELEESGVPVNYWILFKHSFIIPAGRFFSLYIIHKGFLDGMRGFVWSLFSALHFPLAYFKYWQSVKK
ncbi:hypothetical protein A3D01_05035 [Candidatus Woesebacteria bacterium RIFCSPHIGHO2_02_FULL_39_13]|uniref:Glycosyltransferase 2-like domain-containing protein n=1 Tax=Candidatus Woesebacteria bacterium RIFCSPHIGHO2_02_FULL_39_13 TaxID=1802505 RepID=A0A1F7Z034_9BACT|nr:MAG: hypothetical protein A2692_00355 [Candidatus Woesebacteria bacterium RIFCSPHIGHO2_01_FULL_39_95]OGM32911.1 MAG: hypothetical protein A3D01_05035 [Candidatus Woesebacteria bacterium RIFCSPHIGHO2_02_FULL_39_13]OGM74424.1 MAG: hypothetical protein A3H19_05345 [Candidatus Woesebacteria bacterium RIFCSPLOWO2_12_FULL_39_9]